MKRTANGQGAETEKVLVLGKRTEKVRELERIVAGYFCKVCLIRDLPNCIELPLNVDFNMVIVTDSIGVKLNTRLFSNLRSLFPNAKLLCLVDQINQDMEKAMRSAGLIFLGSYDHFSNNYQGILESAVKSRHLGALSIFHIRSAKAT